MSVNLINASVLTTASQTVIGNNKDKASVAYFFRVNADVPLTWADYNGMNAVQRPNGQGLNASAYGVDEVNQSLTMIFYWRTAGGTCPATYKFLPGVVYLIAMTYDKSDPTKQILSVNGVPTLLSNPQSLPLTATANAFYLGASNTGSGSYRRNWSISKLMFWNDYVLTSPEILSIMGGTGDPTNIGLSATWRGYWTMAGTSGAVVTNGDAGIVNSIDGSWPLTKTLNLAVPGSSLVYGDAMPFVSQSGFNTPVVCSSGKSVQIAAKIATTGDPIAVTAGSATIMPTIKINGGSAITLERPFYTGQHEGVLYFLPSGSKVNHGDSVTFSAGTGFFATALGVASGVTDMQIVNKADRPKYEDEDPKEIRVGLNYTYPGSTYYGQEQGPRNYALRMLVDNSIASPPARRADGTLMQNYSCLVNQTAAGNGIDRTSYPMTLGKWVVSWDNNDPSKPTSIVLTGLLGTCTELTEYRNTGDVNGVGQARVYDYQNKTWPVSLAADCDASTTSITVDTVTGLVASNQMWLQIDNEIMDISNLNATTKVLTVVRGAGGTTAASHTSGTSGSSSWWRRNPGVSIAINGPTGEVPNYSNLVIYGPQDWTPPDPPAPVVVDRSPEYSRSPSQFMRDSVSGGIGLVRHMDSCGTFFCTAEPEDHRLDTDAYWGHDSHLFRKFKVSKLEKPPASFYVYNHLGNGETYSATLGVDIITAPEPGTVETITISDADTAPVMAGSRIQIGTEWVRVLDVTGTTCTVVRGSSSPTSPSTIPTQHVAGPVTVGWRIPITSTSQYRQATTVHVLATTDAPHKLRCGMWAVMPIATDLNPLARFPVTLLDPTSVGSRSIRISADPDKWQYIVRSLLLKFENETMEVVSGDQASGVVTTKADITAVHAAGTAGNATAAGVFCVSEDGLDYSWSPRGTDRPYFVTGPNSLLLPLYCYTGTALKIPLMATDVQTWDTTPLIVAGDDTRQFSWELPRSVYSFEYSARMTALSPGAWHWLNIPLLASDDLVDWIARKIRDGLPVGQHKVIVELSNEVWNYFFPFVGPVFGFSQMLGYTATSASWLDWWILRSKQVVDRVRAVFNEGGVNRGGEIIFSIPYQGGNLGLMLNRAIALGINDIEITGGASYTTPGTTAAHMTAFKNADDEQAGDIWLFDLEYYTGSGYGARMRTDKAGIASYKSATGNTKLMHYNYEGGASTSLPIPSTGMNDATVFPNGIERNRDIIYNPNWYNVDRDYYQVLKRVGNVTGCCLFNHCQVPARLPAGTGVYDEMWGITSWHGQKAGRGDGSDGKFDNRTNLFQPGKAGSRSPLSSPEETNVSVRMQSVIDHNIAFFATDPPAENDDMPQRFPTRIVRRRKRNTTPIMTRTAVVTAVVPPDPTPNPTPGTGRRAIVFRMTIS